MSSHYSIIQFMPDPSTDERINIGIIAFDETSTEAVFLHNWERVRRFAGGDIDFIHKFAEDIEDGIQAIGQLPGFSRIPQLTGEQINKLASTWHNSIQISQPRASLNDLASTVNLMSQKFLVERTRSSRAYRNRMKAAAIARASIREALRVHVGEPDAELLVKASTALPGKRKPHMFDGVVMNGIPYYAVHGISFELPEARLLNLQIDALAWAVADVRDYEKSLPIGILALPPKSNSGKNSHRLFSQSISMYKGLGADVLTEKEMREWSTKQAQLVPRQNK